MGKSRSKTNSAGTAPRPLWSGRFSERPAPAVQKYTRSLHLDKRLALQDLDGSRAHVQMLASRGILSEVEVDKLLDGLGAIEEEIRSGQFPFREELEDIHMNVEWRLQELVGDVGRKLHTARSRNDQVALDLKLFCLGTARDWQSALVDVMSVLVARAGESKEGLFPGWTHLQSAQPLSWGHYLLAFAEMFRRDYGRLDGYARIHSISPLGAGALSGTTLDIDPEQTARELGFQASFSNSYDVVGDRDALLELLQIAVQIMIHTSRLAEDFIYFASTPVSWIGLPDEFCTGSSMMPQKKNPDILELMRGKTASVIGHATGLATILKGLASSYHRDLQQDKEHLFGTVEIVSETLEILPPLLSRFTVNPERTQAALKEGFLMATDLAEYLVMKGVPFRTAHEVVGKLVAHCVRRGARLADLTLEEIRTFAAQFGPDVLPLLDPSGVLSRRHHKGSTGLRSIEYQLSQWRKWIKQREVEGRNE